MKKISQILAISLVLIGLAAFLLLQPSIWQTRIESYINNKVFKTGEWQVSIGELGGHLFTTVVGKDVKFTNSKGSQITVPQIRAKINCLRSLIYGLNIKQLELSRIAVEIRPENQPAGERKSFPDFNFVNNPITVHNVKIDGIVAVTVLDTTTKINVELEGSIKSEQGLKLDLKNVNLELAGTDLSLALNNTQVMIRKRDVDISILSGLIKSVPFEGNVLFSWGAENRLVGDLVVNEYKIPEKLFEKTPLKPQFSSIRMDIHLETDFTDYNGKITVSNALGLNMGGEFTLKKYKDYLALEKLLLTSDQTQLSLSGLFEYSGRISGNMQLTQLDLGRWLKRQKETNVSGLVLYEGIIDSGRIDDLSLTMEVQESKLYPDNLISVSGSIAYHDSLLDLPEPLVLNIGPSSVVIKGFVNFREQDLDLALDLNDASVFLINNFWSDSLNSGTATGNLKVTGSFERPTFIVDLTGKNIQYRDLQIKDVGLNAKIEDQGGEEKGFAQVKLGRGEWRTFHFDNGIGEFSFAANKLNIENLQLNSGNNFFQLTGGIKDEKNITVERVQLAYEGHYLINTDPIHIRRDENLFDIKPFTLHVDDGVIEGYLTNDNRIEGRIKLSNVDSEIFSYFVRDKRFKLKGIVFGEMGIQGDINNLDRLIDVSFKNGEIAGQPFNDLIVSLLIRNNILHIDELTLIDGANTGVQVSGVIPLKKTSGESVKVELQTNFKNLNIELFTQFIPDWFHLGGMVSGNFDLGGTTENTSFSFDVKVDDAVFDILSLGTVKGSGKYGNHRLEFTSFSSRRGDNYIEGKGYLPVDYDLGSETFGRLITQDSLWIDTKGHLSNLEFLSAYLAEVDSITGNFDIGLRLSGTPEHPVRDGFINLDNAKVYTILLDDPITHLNGKAKVIKNRFIVDHLSGKMVKRGDRSKGKDNLDIKGEMDLTQFFKPRYDIHATGKNVYFKALIEDIEGVVDLDVNITGRDTITVAGEIAAIDVQMFQEFVSETVGAEPSEEGGIIMNYKLNFPIQGDFNLINSQIDANIGGEVSISQFGNRPADFAGELYIQEGKFYYYGDIFTISDGYLAFDGKGFNPYLDISAETVINGERISISLIGSMDHPRLKLESSSGFSQSDILELLTWRKRFEDQEISSTGFGNQAQAILGAWFESQLEKNLMQISALNQLGLVKDVTISGTGGFLNPNSQEDFSIKADLSDKLSLAYRRSFSLTNPNHMLGVEIKVSRYLSVVGNVDKTGNFHVKYRLRYSY
ncbi:MAG: hypothetical protein GXO92_01340 [FCB group bacterium]|nr:hypothetical protein [FCB group bacterium]